MSITFRALLVNTATGEKKEISLGRCAVESDAEKKAAARCPAGWTVKYLDTACSAKTR